jgi:hypothetical protein
MTRKSNGPETAPRDAQGSPREEAEEAARVVLLPSGAILGRDDLPEAGRTPPLRGARRVVARAVMHGLIDGPEACLRYDVSAAVLQGWIADATRADAAPRRVVFR